MAPQLFTLSNGMRVVHQASIGSSVSHCAIIINAGTRDEKPGQEGLAHFAEHLLFKGTKKRKAFHILNRMEVVGGEMNAYTSKEETCVHASFLTQYFERATELIADIIFNSVFPEKEFAKEKEVVLEEIRSYKDNPYEQIYDDFEGLIFSGHALGHATLGTFDSVKNFKRSDILKLVKENYRPDNMVFSVFGNILPETVRIISEKYLSPPSRNSSSEKNNSFKGYKPREIKTDTPTMQSHFIIGNVAYSIKSKKRIPFTLLNNILGGPGMNSRLNLGIREKYGFTYAIESSYHAFTDTGTFALYLSLDKKSLDKTVVLVHHELKKLCEKRLSSLQLHQYKQQLIGQMAMSLENRAGIMMANGKNIINFGKVFTFKQIVSWIEGITQPQLLEVANEIFDEKRMSTLLYNSA